MRRFLGLLALVPLLLLASCKSTVMEGASVEGPPGGYPRKIVSLSPSTTEIVFEGGSPLLLAGRTSACNYPRKVAAVPVVADFKPNYEKIAQIKPDLIMFDDQLYSDADVQKIKEVCPKILVIKGNTIKEYIESLYDFAKLVGAEQITSEYVGKIEEQIDNAGIAPKLPQPKVAVVMGGSNGEHYIAGVNSFQADVVRVSTGKPIGPDAQMFVPLNAEWLVKENPDVIFVPGDPAPILKDPRFKSIAAVQKGNVVGVNQDIFLRRGWRVNKLIQGVHEYLLEKAK